MTDVEPGQRWRRKTAPHDFVWITDVSGTSVGYRSSNGLAGIPVELFTQRFEAAPKKKRMDTA